MSLEKAIKSGKEHRKEYIGKNYCKSVDKECRNHGSCPWCQGKQKYRRKKREPIVEKDDWEESLEGIYPIGSLREISIFNFDADLDILKQIKELEKEFILPGKWKFKGYMFYNVIFERIE